VVGLARRFTGDEDLAMDVLQETFLYLLKKFPGFALTASFKTFIYPAVKTWRLLPGIRRGRYQSRGGDCPRGGHAAPVESSSPGRFKANTEAAFRGTSGGAAATLRGRLNLAEIARAMDVPWEL